MASIATVVWPMRVPCTAAVFAVPALAIGWRGTDRRGARGAASPVPAKP